MNCYGCGWRCVFDPGDAESAPCLAEVSVDRVLDEALRMVGSANTQPLGVSTSDPLR